MPKGVDLRIWKGDALEFFVDITDQAGTAINLSGKVPYAVLKPVTGNGSSVDFVTQIQGSNRVRFYLSSPITKNLTPGDYIWNFQLTTTSSGDVRTYLAGDIVVVAEVDG